MTAGCPHSPCTLLPSSAAWHVLCLEMWAVGWVSLVYLCSSFAICFFPTGVFFSNLSNLFLPLTLLSPGYVLRNKYSVIAQELSLQMVMNESGKCLRIAWAQWRGLQLVGKLCHLYTGRYHYLYNGYWMTKSVATVSSGTRHPGICVCGSGLLSTLLFEAPQAQLVVFR